MKSFSLLILMNISFLGTTHALVTVSESTLKFCQTKVKSPINDIANEAEKIRKKCIEEIFEEYLKDRDSEIKELSNYSKKIDAELRKVAVKVEIFNADCGLETSRNPKLVKKCRDLSYEKSLIFGRIEKLNSWDEDFKVNATNPNIEVDELIPPPCPTKDYIQKLSGMKNHNRSLYMNWEKCSAQNARS